LLQRGGCRNSSRGNETLGVPKPEPICPEPKIEPGIKQGKKQPERGRKSARGEPKNVVEEIIIKGLADKKSLLGGGNV